MSKINVNTVDTQCGSTLTLGSSGKTVTLASGASQSGFGRTGTVDWCTTAKTSPFTAVSGDGFFVNTTSGAITVTLPSSPSAGDIVALKDYANTWDTNNVTLCRNGSKINGVCGNVSLSTESQSVTLIYVDGTKGWQDIQDSTSNVSGNPGFISATGGTVTTCGDFKIHTFTSDGCFAVTNTSGSGVGAKVSYVVVAGGGGGSGNGGNFDGGAGGGAGGFREGKQACAGYTASPLAATPCSGLPVSIQTYSITVGAGGTAAPGNVAGGNGGVSTFSTITSAGGGGGTNPSPPNDGATGGSGGGGTNAGSGGAGNTPPVSPPQGNPGSGGVNSGSSAGGGGGGATAAAGSASLSPLKGGAGGAGATSSINGTPTARAGGGGGAGYVAGSNPAPNSGGDGGSGGGGSGGSNPGFPHTPFDGQAGTVNTGGGGGAAANDGAAGSGGAGGSGVVIIRYKFQ